MVEFAPTLAYRLCALAEQAYWYDTFEPWALAEGYLAARGFHEDSIQAKVLCDENAILIVFTATDLLVLKEWVKYDFDLRRSPMLGGWVHKGFRRALWAGGPVPEGTRQAEEKSLFMQINRYVLDALVPRFGYLPIYVGGHSLGAAMAKLFLAELAEQARRGTTGLLRPEQITACYTTGEPRVGNAAVVKALEETYGGRMIQGIFRRDWVPAVPYRYLGFRESGAPHYIDKHGNITFGSRGPHLLRLSGKDHLPQRYARAYLNIRRRKDGEPPLPVIGGPRQFWQDFKEVVLHPGRGNP